MKARLRLFAAILCAVMMVTVVQPIFAEEKSVIEYDKNKYELLESLNIIDEKFCENETVNRICFLKAVCSIMTEDKLSDLEAFNFGALKQITSAENYVAFDAQRAITSYEAVTMLVSLLGRKEVALAAGGYPMGFVNEGRSLRVYPKGLVNEDLKVGTAIDMIYNAIDVNMLVADEFADPGKITYKKIDETAIYYYRGLRRIEGIMTSNEYTSLNDANGGAEGRISVDWSAFKTNLTGEQFNDKLGYPVIAYVDESDILVGVIKNDDEDFATLTLTDDEIKQVSDDCRVLKYYDGKRLEDIDLSNVLDVIYNGKAIPDYTNTDLIPTNGSVELIDNDDDEIYDVAIVKNYELYYVDYASGKSKVLYNKYDNTQNPYIELDNNNMIYEFTLNGEIISISKLLPEDVVSVACSKSGDETIVEGIVSREKIYGKIKSVDKHEGTLVFADENGVENEYEINPILLAENEQSQNKIVIGDATCYIDNFGRVAVIKASKQEFYAYVVKLKYNEDEDRAVVKYLDEDNVWRETKFAAKVRCNDVSMECDRAYDELGGRDFSEKLMRIFLNEDGEIKRITAANVLRNGDDKFVESKNLTEYWYQQNFSFNWKVYLEDDATVFMIPQTPTRDLDSYMAVKPGYLFGGRSYTAKIYNMDEFNVSGLALVYNVDTAPSSSSSWYIVTDKVEEINSDDEIVTRIYSSLGNDETNTVAGKDDAVLDDVNIGDVIIFSLNQKNQIASAPTKIFDVEVGPEKMSASNLHGEFIRTAGTLLDINAESNKLRIDNGSEVVYSIDAGTSIQIYIVDENKITKGNIRDLKIGDHMILSYYYSDLSQVMAIRY